MHACVGAAAPVGGCHVLHCTDTCMRESVQRRRSVAPRPALYWHMHAGVGAAASVGGCHAALMEQAARRPRKQSGAGPKHPRQQASACHWVGLPTLDMPTNTTCLPTLHAYQHYMPTNTV